MKTYDVVIIGAGLAGLQCARLLARQGAEILLVDRKTELAKGVHTTGIFVRKTLEDFEFPAGTLGRAIRKVNLYSPCLRPIALESEKDEFRVGKMGVLYESLLRECTDRGVEFLGGARCVSAEVPADADSATIVRLEKNGSAFAVGARVLIGADGANSRVAKDLGLDENREWIVGYEEVFRSNNDGEPVLHCFLDARLAPGYLAWIADDGEEVHVGVGGYAAGFNPRAALREFREKTRHLYDPGEAEPVESRGGRIPVGGVLRRIANDHGLLIGDAAGAVSPLTAGGLDPAMRLSKFAAEIVAERLRTADPRVLRRYSGELFRARFVSRLWMRRVIKTFTSQRLLELGCVFLRGRVGRRFANHVFFGRGSFPDVEINHLPVRRLSKI
ncbi:MAG: NAD(P)/FAD-dependent oxidoreductase [Acidobacteria bacterium]|nr:NAD(P)/FAD-dependent oxidoreductase [Acidobacteriota bacterium]